MLPLLEAIVMINSSLGTEMPSCEPLVGFFFAGAIVSLGELKANNTPHNTLKIPGMTNAIRHPKYLTIKPVTTAAMAKPKLPAKPFTPIVQPGRSDP